MMHKYIICIILICTQVVPNTSNIKLKAQKFLQEKNITTAIGNVILTSDNYHILSDKLKYDNNKTVLEFFDNISIKDNKNNISLKAKYLKTILKNDNLYIKNSVLIDNNSHIWVKAECSEKSNNIYKLEHALFSSCSDKSNPFWKIKFKKGSYDKNQDVLTLHNSVVYIKSVPTLYLPYITINMSDKQKSGLLIPQVSLLQNRAYMQPIFFALKDNIDLEVTPFIREKEGIGVYSKLRFIDSNTSQGSISFGKFNNYTDTTDSLLKDTKFTGAEFKYINISKEEEENKLSILSSDIELFDNESYLKFKTLDTLNLQLDSISNSKIAYIYKNEDWSISTQVKNIKDIKTNSNIQLLPLIKIDKTQNFINDKLSYGFTYKFEHRNIQDRINPAYQEANMPHFYNISLIDEFLNVQMKNEIKLTKQDFLKQGTIIQSESSLQDYLSVELSSKLAKKYKDIVHNIDFSVYQRTILADLESDSFVIPDGDKDKIGILVKQNFLENGKNFLSHSIYQEAYKNKIDETFNTLSDTVSNIQYTGQNINIYNKSNYSLKDNIISYSSTALELKNNNTNIIVSHLLEDNRKEKKKTNYIGANIKNTLSKNLKLELSIEANQESKEIKKWTGSVEYMQDCWGYLLKFGKSHIPYSYQANTDELNNNLIYFQVKFNPIGGISHGYYF